MEDETSAGAILDRLRIGANAKSDAELGRKLGVGQQSVSNARNSGKVPDAWIRKAATELGISADWVLTGIGSMLFAAETLESSSHHVTMIPMVEARLSAGHGSFETNNTIEKKYSFRSDFLHRKGTVSQMVMMRVEGDSMSPAIENGDVVLIDQSQTAPRAGSIYAVGVEDVVYLKQFDARPGKIILSSFNLAYPPFEIDAQGDLESSVRIIGRLIWSCREW